MIISKVLLLLTLASATTFGQFAQPYYHHQPTFYNNTVPSYEQMYPNNGRPFFNQYAGNRRAVMRKTSVTVTVSIEEAQTWYGKTEILPTDGRQLVFDSSVLSETAFNRICEKAVYMKCCMVIRYSNFKSLSCPYLRRIEPCSEGRPAIELVGNMRLSRFQVPMGLAYPRMGVPVLVELNPLIPTIELSSIAAACPRCQVTSDIACGFMERAVYSTRDLVRRCAGQKIIRPALGYMIELNSQTVTEMELNALCANAVYLEACITITQSSFQSLRCPRLRTLKPCRPDRPAITIVGNPHFHELILPPSLTFPIEGIPIKIEDNPLYTLAAATRIQQSCSTCQIVTNEVNTMRKGYTEWFGSVRIMPQPHSILVFDSNSIPESDMNRIFENVVFMKACINIVNSDYRSFRCPNLRRLQSCRPDRPAIVVTNNRYLQHFYLPTDFTYEQGTAPIIIMEMNPLLSSSLLTVFQQNFLSSHVSRDIVCGLGRHPKTVEEFLSSCIGAAIIKPAAGSILEITSQQVSEMELNALCANAVYMEICISVKQSNFASLRCPKLQKLIPCRPDRYAIEVIGNMYLKDFYVPTSIQLPQTGVPLYFKLNPLLPHEVLLALQTASPNSILMKDIACGLGNQPFTVDQLIRACTGHEIIRPAYGSILELDATKITQEQLNEMLFNVVYLEICMVISKSNFQYLRFPNLRMLRPCAPDRPALLIERNTRLESIEFPPDVIFPAEPSVPPVYIEVNERIKKETLVRVQKQCQSCVSISEGEFVTPLDVQHLYGSERIESPEGRTWIIHSSMFSEENMNNLFVNAVYMKVTVIVMDSTFRRLRFPKLRQMEFNTADQPIIVLLNNPYLEEFYLPDNIVYPKDRVPLNIHLNPMLPYRPLEMMIQNCPHCQITPDIACGLRKKLYTQVELVTTCAGKGIITPPEGYILEVHSDYVSESQMNALCMKAIQMQICITIKGSSFRSLRCPLLRRLKSCQPGRPAITIIENYQFDELLIPQDISFDQNETPFLIELNPRLPYRSLQELQNKCTRCTITKDIACGLAQRVQLQYTEVEILQKCAYANIIRPPPGFMIVLDSRTATETQINALCANAVYMELCLTVSRSNFRSLRCPKLRFLKSCRPDQPAITITDNAEFEILQVSSSLSYSEEGVPFLIENNPKLPSNSLVQIQQSCTKCITVIKEEMLTEELAQQYVSKVRIEPPHGSMLILHSSQISQRTMNLICEKALYIKACIVITNSNYRSLRCPLLKQIEPCRPDRPVFTIYNNPFFTELNLPSSCTYPSYGVPMRIEINPLLPPEVITEYQIRCPQCEVTPDIACGLGNRPYTTSQLIERCQYKSVIRPAPGFRLILDATTMTEMQLNNLCANAVYMEICLTIKRTQFRSIRCPMLRMLVPCEPGRPALEIVENELLETLSIPPDCKFPSQGITIYSRMNLRLPTAELQMLQNSCPQCHLLDDISCGLGRGHHTQAEILLACANKEIIRPASGFIIEIDGLLATEAQLNAMCANAVYMEACIKIKGSTFSSIKCPKLQILKPCKPDMPAFSFTENQMLVDLSIPWDVKLPDEGIPMVILDNERLPKETITQIQQICAKCILMSHTEVVTSEGARYWIGKERIEPPSGVNLVFDSESLSEEQINGICAKAVYMKACIVISNSMIRSLRCPNLRRIEPCTPARPAITIFNNILLSEVILHPEISYPIEGLPMVIEINPLLPADVLEIYQKNCPRCKVTQDIACGLKSQRYTTEEIVSACTNKAVIRAAPGYRLYIHSSRVSEGEMNALCAQAIYMEVCITIEKSSFISLNCPVLRKLVSCDPARPAIVVLDNPFLENFYLPLDVLLPEVGIPLYIKQNSLLPSAYLAKLQRLCPNCHIIQDIACGLAGQKYTIRNLIRACRGKEVIRPELGSEIMLSSEDISEREMNELCANAVYMEVCITVKQSSFRSLRCPKLKVLRPCRPDWPAILISGNTALTELVFSNEIEWQRVGVPIWITSNRHVPPQIVSQLQQRCPKCISTQEEELVMPELAQQMFGAHRIVPPSGRMYVFDSRFLSEVHMNYICSKARYIKGCFVIANSYITSFRCPFLQRIESCSPDRPAIRFYNNKFLQEFIVPDSLTFSKATIPMMFEINPLLPSATLISLQHRCPSCRVTGDLGCGLDFNRRKYTPVEIAQACAYRAVIKPYPGQQLRFDSSVITEQLMNAMCSKAIYIEACITIKNSFHRYLSLPMIETIQSCQAGREAIVIMDNRKFEYFELPKRVSFLTTGSPIHLEMNPHLPTTALTNLASVCSRCSVTEDIACGLGDRTYNFEELVEACAGKAVVKANRGYYLVASSDTVTEYQFNRLCENAVYMEICIKINNSQYTSIRCPRLQEIVSCKKQSTAIMITNNPLLKEISFPMLTTIPGGQSPVLITGNPHVPISQLERFRVLCPRCTLNVNRLINQVNDGHVLSRSISSLSRSRS